MNHQGQIQGSQLPPNEVQDSFGDVPLNLTRFQIPRKESCTRAFITAFTEQLPIYAAYLAMIILIFYVAMISPFYFDDVEKDSLSIIYFQIVFVSVFSFCLFTLIMLQIYLTKVTPWGFVISNARQFKRYILHRPIINAMYDSTRYSVKDVYEKLTRFRAAKPSLRTYVIYGPKTATPRNNYSGLECAYVEQNLKCYKDLSPMPDVFIENMLDSRSRVKEININSQFYLTPTQSQQIQELERRISNSYAAHYENVHVKSSLVFNNEERYIQNERIIMDTRKGEKKLNSVRSSSTGQDGYTYHYNQDYVPAVIESTYIESYKDISTQNQAQDHNQQPDGYLYANDSVYADEVSSYGGPLRSRESCLSNFLFTIFFSHQIFLRLALFNLTSIYTWLVVWRWVVPRYSYTVCKYIEAESDESILSIPTQPGTLNPLVRQLFQLFDPDNVQ